MNIIKIGDYEINRRLLNFTQIAHECGYSQAYISMLLNGKRKNEKALNKVLSVIEEQKTSLIKYTGKAV